MTASILTCNCCRQPPRRQTDDYPHLTEETLPMNIPSLLCRKKHHQVNTFVKFGTPFNVLTIQSKFWVEFPCSEAMQVFLKTQVYRPKRLGRKGKKRFIIQFCPSDVWRGFLWVAGGIQPAYSSPPTSSLFQWNDPVEQATGAERRMHYLMHFLICNSSNRQSGPFIQTDVLARSSARVWLMHSRSWTLCFCLLDT